MRGVASRVFLNGGDTIAASQYSSIDVAGITKPPASSAATVKAAIDKRREVHTTVTESEVPGQSICLDELAPVPEDPADD